MKVRIIPAVIALAISALVAFGYYSFCRCADMQWWVAIVGGVSLFLTFGTALAVSFATSRTTTNAKVVSGVGAFVLLLLNVVFCCFTCFSLAWYIILNGLLLLLWVILLYAIVRAAQ